MKQISRVSTINCLPTHVVATIILSYFFYFFETFTYVNCIGEKTNNSILQATLSLIQVKNSCWKFFETNNVVISFHFVFPSLSFPSPSAACINKSILLKANIGRKTLCHHYRLLSLALKGKIFQLKTNSYCVLD